LLDCGDGSSDEDAATSTLNVREELLVTECSSRDAAGTIDEIFDDNDGNMVFLLNACSGSVL